jgi:hypothetical protein
MPDTMDEITLPDTQPYRVLGVGAVYFAPAAVIGGDGKPTVVHVNKLATRGQVIDLVPFEARRLLDLGAVKEADEPKSYDEMDGGELADIARSRGLAVRGSGADESVPLREDYINTLNAFDTGSDATVMGVATAASGPGGVTVLGTHPSVASSVPDVSDTAALAKYISDEKLNASDTVALAEGDPDRAVFVLEAEKTAHSGDPRATVEKPLERLIEQESDSQ